MDQIQNKSRFIRSAIWNLIGFFASTGVMFLMMPYIINILGIDNYGISGLLTAFVVPLGLLGLGVGPAVARKIAADQGFNGINHSPKLIYIQTGTLLGIIIGVIGCVVLITIAPIVFPIFFTKIDISKDDLIICFLFIGLQWFFNQITSSWSAAVIGLQEYKFTAMAQTIQNLLTTGLGVTMLWLGFGLKGYIFSFFLTSFLLFFYWISISKHIFGWRALLPILNVKIARSYLRFGAWFSVGQIGKIFGTEGQRYIAGIFLGSTAVGILNISLKVMNSLYQVSGRIIEVMYPHFSSQSHLNITDRVKNFIILGGLSSLLLNTTLGTLAILAYPLLNVWMNPYIANDGYLLLQLMCFGSILMGSVGPSYYFFLSEGKSRFTGVIALFTCLAMTLISVSFIRLFKLELISIGYGFIAAGITMMSCYLIVFLRKSKFLDFTYFRGLIVYLISPTLTTITIYFLSLSLKPVYTSITSFLTLGFYASLLFVILLFFGIMVIFLCDRLFKINFIPKIDDLINLKYLKLLKNSIKL